MKQKIYNVRTDKSNLLIYKDGKALKKKIAEEKKLQEKSVSITKNNSTTDVNADADYYGLKSVNVNVNIPITDAMDVSYTENGVYEITPDPGDEGIKKINVSVDVTATSSKLNFSDINYYDIDSVQTDLAYSKTKLEEWDPTNTSANTLYFNDKTLKYAPKIDTSKVMNMSLMFYNCSKLTLVPLFDTSNVTSMSNMFAYCSSLTTVPQFVTSSVTSMVYMFYNCSSLNSVPQFDTSNVTNMNSMFYNCKKLTTVPLFDTSSVTSMDKMFLFCSSLTSVGGFTDLGKAFTSAQIFDLSSCPITSGSVINIANTIYDMNQNTSIQSATIKFKSTVYSALTDEQKTLFANKGWTVSA